MTREVVEQDDIEIDIPALRAKYEEERNKRLRSEGDQQFRSLDGKFAHFGVDPHVEPGFSRSPLSDDVDVLIVGGGFGGLLAGGRLREQGIEKIRIVDKAGDFGGTWYWNRYPGAACDVESYIYLPLLEELDVLPTEKYARGSEIFEHCQRLARHYDLYRDALFQTEVRELRWDQNILRWIVTTNRDDRIRARFVISCTGLLSKPKLPGIAGIDTFEGHCFHTSRWDFDYTGGGSHGDLTGLTDKNVAIIGTGSTAIQCVPHLGQWAKKLFVFQRTPSSVDVRNNRPTDVEWAKALVPGWQRKRMDNFTMVTSGIYQPEDLVDDSWTDIVKHSAPPVGGDSLAAADPDKLQLAEMKKMEKARRRIDAVVSDPTTAEALKPYYHYFCKRPCFHDEYLPTFNRPNVKLVDTKGRGVDRITPTGLVVDGQEYPVDCIVFATGFDFMSEYVNESGLTVFGRDGRSLADHWDQGTRTLFGLQTAGFPNFFLMSLVQSGVAINYVHIADEQARHIAYIIGKCQADAIAAVEPTPDAEEKWVDQILQKAGPRRAFLEACTPGYYNYEGKRRRSIELNDPYGGGAIEYLDILQKWRTDDRLSGLIIDRAALGAADNDKDVLPPDGSSGAVSG